MAKLHTYATYLKSVNNIRRIYDVSTHAYRENFIKGKEALRDPARVDEIVKIDTSGDKSGYRLDLITYQARDVYPELLRSILLIRLVSVFEIFLIDSVDVIADRDMRPFMNDTKIELKIDHLLQLIAAGGVTKHIVSKIRRKLSNSSIDDVVKIYHKIFSIVVAEKPLPLDKVREIYDRRHLYVHSDGYPDQAYMKKHKPVAFVRNNRIGVSSEYLINSISCLSAVAKNVKNQLDNKYPGEHDWVQQKGLVDAGGIPPSLRHVEFEPKKQSDIALLLDMAMLVRGGTTLGMITVWYSHSKTTCRIVLGGHEHAVNEYLKTLYLMHKDGDLKRLTVAKLN